MLKNQHILEKQRNHIHIERPILYIDLAADVDCTGETDAKGEINTTRRLRHPFEALR